MADQPMPGPAIGYASNSNESTQTASVQSPESSPPDITRLGDILLQTTERLNLRQDGRVSWLSRVLLNGIQECSDLAKGLKEMKSRLLEDETRLKGKLEEADTQRLHQESIKNDSKREEDSRIMAMANAHASTIEERSRTISRLESDAKSNDSTILSLRKAAEERKIRLEEKEAEMTLLAKEKKRFQDEASTLQSRIKSLQDSLHGLEVEHQKARQEEADSSKKRIHELEQQCTKAANQSSALQMRVSSFERQVIDSGRDREALVQANKESTEKCSALQQRIDSLEGETAEQNQRIQSLQAQLDAQRRVHDEVCDASDDIQLQLLESEYRHVERADRIYTAASIVNRLRSERDLALANAARFEAKANDSTTACEATGRQLTESKEEVSSLGSRLEVSNTAKERLEQELKELKESKEKVLQQRDDCLAEAARLRQELDQATTSNIESIKGYESSLEKASLEVKKLQKRIEELQESREELERRQTKSSAEVSSLRVQVQKASTARQLADDQIARLQRLYDASQDEASARAEAVSRLEEEAASMERTVSRLENADCKKCTARIDEILSLKRKLGDGIDQGPPSKRFCVSTGSIADDDSTIVQESPNQSPSELPLRVVTAGDSITEVGTSRLQNTIGTPSEQERAVVDLYDEDDAAVPESENRPERATPSSSREASTILPGVSDDDRYVLTSIRVYPASKGDVFFDNLPPVATMPHLIQRAVLDLIHTRQNSRHWENVESSPGHYCVNSKAKKRKTEGNSTHSACVSCVREKLPCLQIFGRWNPAAVLCPLPIKFRKAVEEDDIHFYIKE